MIEPLTEDTYWLSHCQETATRHLHHSEYLIDGEAGTVLIDSGSELFREEIISETNRLTDGEGPDVVMLTHSTLPHTENVAAFEEEWDDVETIAATSRYPEIIGLPQATKGRFDHPVSYAGRTYSFHEPLLTDVTLSQWIFDHESRVLFTAEAFGHYHRPGSCGATWNPDAEGGYEEISAFYYDKLPFLDYLDCDRLAASLEAFLDTLDVAYIAPIHGNPVHESDVENYLDVVVAAIRE